PPWECFNATGPLPDYPFEGDESGKDDHDDSNEGNAKENIVHDAAFSFSLPGSACRAESVVELLTRLSASDRASSNAGQDIPAFSLQVQWILISFKGSRSSAARSSRSFLRNSISRRSNSVSSFRAASKMRSRGAVPGCVRSVITHPSVL